MHLWQNSVCMCCRLWNILCGACLRVLEGHEELVRCIRFDSKRIVSGAYDGSVICERRKTCSLIIFLSLSLFLYFSLSLFLSFPFFISRPLFRSFYLSCSDSHKFLFVWFISIWMNGTFYRKIKVWDLVAAMDPRSVPGSLCLSTLNVGYLSQFFQIVFIINDLYVFFIIRNLFLISRAKKF